MPKCPTAAGLIGIASTYGGYSLVLLGEWTHRGINLGPELTDAQVFAQAMIRRYSPPSRALSIQPRFAWLYLRASPNWISGTARLRSTRRKSPSGSKWTNNGANTAAESGLYPDRSSDSSSVATISGHQCVQRHARLRALR